MAIELKKCACRNCCNFFSINKKQVLKKYCGVKCKNDETYQIEKDLGGRNVYFPKVCKFEDCSNFFMPDHAAIKYCSPKCCQSQADKNYKRENADALRERDKLAARRYRAAWSEETREIKRKQVRENNKRWYHALSEEDRHERAKRQYEKCDKDRKRHLARKSKRKKYKNDANFRMRHILRSRLRNALLNQNVTKHAPTLELIGCTIEKLKDYIEAQFEPWMTWDNWAHDTWHIDHIKPCASFDLSDPEQQRACFHYSNLRPLDAKENMRKNSRLNNAPNTTLQRPAP